MVVQHNLQAMNSNRMLGITTNTVAGSTEKLSSGYRINRAADDAAGLSISEKMRKQIRGLDQASANAEDGISSVQTAEGALQEVTDMLQRMNELVVQAANGTNSETDRQYIQDEIDQLITEVDRVAETTKFNETYLLKGDSASNGKTVFTQSYAVTYTRYTGSNAVNTSSIKFNYTGSSALIIASASVSDSGVANGYSATAEILTAGDDITKYLDKVDNKQDIKEGINTTSYTAFKLATAQSQISSLSVNSLTGQIEVDSGKEVYVLDKSTNQVIHLKEGGSVEKYINSMNTSTTGETIKYMEAKDGYAFLTTADAADEYDIKADTSEMQLYDSAGNEVSGVKLRDYYNDFGVYTNNSLYLDNEGKTALSSASISQYITQTQTHVAGDLNFSLHVGADSASTNKINANIQSMSAASLGINVLKSSEAGIVDTTGNKATDAIDVIAEALQQVSTQRSALGAIQNRLEHTIKNLDNVVENTTAAESAIRDTDMAEEMVKYSNANILSQAGQSMLAQANQSNQSVLSILG